MVTDQLKRALDYCFTAIVDLQRPERSATPEDLHSLKAELQAEIAELKATRQASEEAAASQQAAQQVMAVHALELLLHSAEDRAVTARRVGAQVCLLESKAITVMHLSEKGICGHSRCTGISVCSGLASSI